MFNNPDHPFHRLRTQLIFSFLISFIAISLAIGIPVVLTMNRQASSQANLLLDQALLSTRAFLSGEEADIENLSLLISQRPSFARLLEAGDFPALQEYIVTIQEGADLDLLLICSNGTLVGSTGPAPSWYEYCKAGPGSGYSASTDDLFLHASAGLDLPGQRGYSIVIIKSLYTILKELQRQTGLLYFILQNNHVIKTSDTQPEISEAQARALDQTIHEVERSSPEWQQIDYQEHQYLLGSIELKALPEYRLMAGLNIDDQLAMQRGLKLTLILGLILIALAASLLGIYLSQRISQPMDRLAHAATEFRRGRLDTPVLLHSQIYEVRQLANTLEDARVALQHSLHQLHARSAWNEQLLNSIVEGILTLDHQNRITFASEGVSSIIDGPVERIAGKKVDEIFLPIEGELSFSSQLPEVGQSRRISVEINGAHKLLAVTKASFMPPEAENGNRAVVIRDVTQDEYIHRLLGDFLANITHEFRTPLAALEASVELLLDNLPSLSKEELEELLVSLNLGIIDLQTLIDNLIESASIEAGRFKVSIQPASFDSILQDAFKFIQPLAEKYGIKLIAPKAASPTMVMADHRRTVQVLVNLFSNAIKFSPPDASIRVDYQEKDGNLFVQVTDEGSGFSGEQRNNVFRRFSHMDTSNGRSRHGAGLGLSVVKAIVEAQQGEVGLGDLHEQNTRIWFSIPLAGAQK